MKASDIIAKLEGEYRSKSTYCISNAYIFKSDWESDFFALTKSGYAIEFEVKTSRAYFKADFKKEAKHSILKTGYYQKISRDLQKNENPNQQSLFRWVETESTEIHEKRPNRFYYVVPAGLIEPDEVPEYAGLIYCDYSINIIKPAPFIHKEKINFKEQFCDKFYIYWQNELYERKTLKNHLNAHVYQLQEIKKHIDAGDYDAAKSYISNILSSEIK